MLETGTYLTTDYTISENDDSNGTVTETGNALDETSTTTSVSTASSTIQESGGDSSTGNDYDLTKTTTSSETQTETADDLSGAYTVTTTADSTITTEETNTQGSYGSTFTEITIDDSTVRETGDSLTGDYTQTISDSSTTTDNDVGSNASGSFSFTETSSQSYSGAIETGDSLDGDYTLDKSPSGPYTLVETGVDASGTTFTLTETGSISFSVHETGDSLSGDFTRTTTGTDSSYTLAETGTNSLGGFTETVIGSDAFSVTESGNTDNQTLDRTVTGSGTYTLADSGIGATLTSGSGSIGYTVSETDDARSGDLSQTEAGTDRYALLQSFINAANSQGSTSPGNMNFVAFGVPFVDPNYTHEEAQALYYVESLGNPNIGSFQNWIQANRITIVSGQSRPIPTPRLNMPGFGGSQGNSGTTLRPPTFCATCHGTLDGIYQNIAAIPQLMDRAPPGQMAALGSLAQGEAFWSRVFGAARVIGAVLTVPLIVTLSGTGVGAPFAVALSGWAGDQFGTGVREIASGRVQSSLGSQWLRENVGGFPGVLLGMGYDVGPPVAGAWLANRLGGAGSVGAGAAGAPAQGARTVYNLGDVPVDVNRLPQAVPANQTVNPARAYGGTYVLEQNPLTMTPQEFHAFVSNNLPGNAFPQRLTVIETPAGSVRPDPSVPTTPPGTGHIPPNSGARVTAVYEITYDPFGNPTFRRIR
jgi:hypothetical protein